MLHKRIGKSKIFTILAVSFIATLFAYLTLFLPEFSEWRLQSADSLFQFRGAVPIDSSIIIVGIDSTALKTVPHEDIPSGHYARALLNLERAGARWIVLNEELFDLNARQPEADYELATVLQQQKNIVLSGKLVLEPGHPDLSPSYILKPHSWFATSAEDWALINLREDKDGHLRNYKLYFSHDDSLFASMALSLFCKIHGYDFGRDLQFNRHAIIYPDGYIPHNIEQTIPINYRGPAGTFPHVSLAQVLNDSQISRLRHPELPSLTDHIRNGTFKDKIVLIGQVLQGRPVARYTPFSQNRGRDQKMANVEIQANALHTLLSGEFILPVSNRLVFIMSAVLAFILAALTIRLKPWQIFLTTLFFIVGIRGVTFIFFQQFGLLASHVMPVTAVSVVFGLLLLRHFILKYLEKQQIRKVFERYVSPNIIRKMVHSGELPNLAGERRDLTVLVSDLRHFTSFLQSHNPSTVVSRLSEYLKEVSNIIYQQQGSLDKFVGDEIMAVFGAPYFLEDHAERSCIAAVEMVERLRFLQKKYSQEGKAYFNIGIGINTGSSITGNVGANDAFDYTVIGDEISLGAHIEHANKTYSTTILMSERTYQQVKFKIWAREIDYIRFLGTPRPIRLYELRGVSPLPQIEQELIIDTFSEGLMLYRNRHYSDALKTFRQVLRYFPSDGPSRVYTIRCLNFLESRPVEEWDGIHDLQLS